MQDDWIPWEGGECPVEAGTWTAVRFGDGHECVDDDPEGWFWKQSTPPRSFDSIAYRVVPK